jgi:hypothetical protein
LVRAAGLQPAGRGFESLSAHHCDVGERENDRRRATRTERARTARHGGRDRKRDQPASRAERGTSEHRAGGRGGRTCGSSVVGGALTQGWRQSAVSDSAGEPRCDLLDQPCIAVRITERAERSVAGVLGVGAGLPSFDGERRAVPHVTHVDVTADKSVMGRFDVGDGQRPDGRPRRGLVESLAERDRAP